MIRNLHWLDGIDADLTVKEGLVRLGIGVVIAFGVYQILLKPLVVKPFTRSRR